MPTNVRIIHAHDFIKATAEGDFDFEETRRLLLEVATAAGPLKDFDIILDTRKATSHLSISDLWNLANSLGQFGKTFRRKTAILCSTDRLDNATFFALCAENRGFAVQAFIDAAEAIDWLSMPSEHEQSA